MNVSTPLSQLPTFSAAAPGSPGMQPSPPPQQPMQPQPVFHQQPPMQQQQQPAFHQQPPMQPQLQPQPQLQVQQPGFPPPQQQQPPMQQQPQPQYAPDAMVGDEDPTVNEVFRQINGSFAPAPPLGDEQLQQQPHQQPQQAQQQQPKSSSSFLTMDSSWMELARLALVVALLYAFMAMMPVDKWLAEYAPAIFAQAPYAVVAKSAMFAILYVLAMRVPSM